ncbi:MAG TPA: hypothetical protein VLX44_14410 [Xanthobacteraceae bacterium]|nr:hypothetical protein [Xanthobacteraceae bacterium]
MLWSLVVLALGFVVAAALFPRTVLVPVLVGLFWVTTLFHNTTPPPIAEGVVLTGDPTRIMEVGARLTTVLQQKFPVGTSESVLKSTLSRQGFKPVPPPASCLMPMATLPAAECKQLKYEWGDGLVCAATMWVAWTTDDKGGIASVRGSYFSACL